MTRFLYSIFLIALCVHFVSADFITAPSPKDIMDMIDDSSRQVEGSQNGWFFRPGDIRPGRISLSTAKEKLQYKDKDSFTIIPNNVWGTYTYVFTKLNSTKIGESPKDIQTQLDDRSGRDTLFHARTIAFDDMKTFIEADKKFLMNGTIERVEDNGEILYGSFQFGGEKIDARLSLLSSESKASVPTYANIPYGDHWQQTFDFYQAQSDKPTPVAVAIHGGGWGALDKKNTLGLETQLLDKGISVASVNYRFIHDDDADHFNPPVQMVMEDSARAIQMLRFLARELNIDKERIGAAGGSAGGCTSLWIALHDDLAQPSSSDPTARESSRLYCAGGYDPQTSLDPIQMRKWIPGITYGAHAYGMESLDECIANYEQLKPWIDEYSPYALISSDDPPIYLSNPVRSIEPQPDEKGWLTHSPWFSIKLHKRLLEAGVESYLDYKGHRNPEYGASLANFFANILTRD